MTDIVGDGIQKTLTGGNGDDTLIGSATSENLNSGNGNDTISGGGGDDRINGGAGWDTAVYQDSVDDVTFAWKDGKLIISTATEGTDTLHNVETLEFASTSYAVGGAVARSDAHAAGENEALTLDVLSNDLSLKAGAGLHILRADGAPAQPGDLVALTREGAAIRLGAAGVLIFTPGTAYDGLSHGQVLTTSFSYTIDNGTGGTATALVTLTIAGTNDGPTVTAAVEGRVREGAGPLVVDLVQHARDVDAGAVLRVEDVVWSGGAGLPQGIHLASNELHVDANDAAFSHLAEGASARFEFTYFVVDEHGARVEQTASVTVTGSNQAPLVSAAIVAVAAEGAAPIALDLLANATDGDDGAVLHVENLVWSGGAGAVPAGFSLSGGTLLVDATHVAYDSLAEGESLTSTLTYEVVDEHGARVQQTATVTIRGANDGPLARDILARTHENGSFTGSFDASDIDGDVLLFEIVDDVPEGQGSITVHAGGSFTFDPGTDFDTLAEGQEVSVSFSYRAFDGRAYSETRTVVMQVVGTDDGPVAHGASATLNEDGSVVGTVTWTDLDGGPAPLALVSDHTSNGTLTFDTATGKYTYTPNDDYFGSADGFTFSVGESQGSVSFVVAPVNDEPVLSIAAAGPIVKEDTAAQSSSVFQLAPADLDGDPLAYDLTGWTALGGSRYEKVGIYGAGVLDVLANTFTYTIDNGSPRTNALNSGQTVVDPFTLTVLDPSGASSSVQVDVAVEGSNDFNAALRVNFEERFGGFSYLADGYQGFNWRVPGGVLGTFDGDMSGGGYSAAGSNIIAYTPGEREPVTITRTDGSDFLFDQVALTAAWQSWMIVQVSGYNDGALVGQQNVYITNDGPTNVDVDWGAIDKLEFDVTQVSGILDAGGGGKHLVLDNFLFYV